MRRGCGEVFIPLPLGANLKRFNRPHKSSQTENLVRSDVGGVCHRLQAGELFENGRKSEVSCGEAAIGNGRLDKLTFLCNPARSTRGEV